MKDIYKERLFILSRYLFDSGINFILDSRIRILISRQSHSWWSQFQLKAGGDSQAR